MNATEDRLRTELRLAALNLAPTVRTEFAVHADLARGRAARRRRHARRMIAGLVVAGGLSAVGATVAQPNNSAQHMSPAANLTAYSGEQPATFRVRVAPAGWHVSRLSASVIEFSPNEVAAAQPQLAISQPAGGRSLPADQVEPLTVSLQRSQPVPVGAVATNATVAGHSATIYRFTAPGAAQVAGSARLDVRISSTTRLIVTVGPTLRWDDQRIVQFANSVQVPSS